MNLKAIFEISAAIVASFGGAGAIIIGLSSWLGKVWANRILENEKYEHSRELEEYKEKLSEQLAKVGAINDKALYISKAHYDNEYRIYSEIWEKLHKATLFSEDLFPRGIASIPIDLEERKKFNQEKYKNFVDAFNEFSITTDKYAPFYKSEFYEKFKSIRKICQSFGVDFEIYVLDDCADPMSSDMKREVYHTRHDELRPLKEDLQNQIRDYLTQLRLGD